MNKRLLWSIAFFEIGLFIFLRFYNIRQSLFFFNDMGRDLLVLQQWHDTGKPPLLGPQTSALPFNQSAIYFYLLYPAFILFAHSPLTALYTLAFVYVAAFIFGLIALKNQPQLQKIVLIAFFLISIHPQYIIQSRYVWNPSLATPFIITAILSSFLLTKKYSTKIAIIFGLSLSTALSLTYSIAPFFIAIVLAVLFKVRHRIKTLLILMFSLFLTNLPTIAFELKHKFILLKATFTQGSPPQQDLSLVGKVNNLSGYLLNLPHSIPIFSIILLIFLIILKKDSPRLRFVLLLFFSTFIINLITPITIQSHYIFAYTSLFFIIIALLPIKVRLISLILFTFFYLRPPIISNYFIPAPRTYNQMLDCFHQVCSQIHVPVFVSVQSDFHPYHHGPEHRYLLQVSGCQVKSIEDEPEAASVMALVLDNSSYDPDKTKFYELDLFGPSHVTHTFNCLPNFQTLILQKDEI